MLNNTWIAPPQIRAECNWANKIFLSTYPWRGRVLRWQQLGPCHGASQVRDTLRDMWWWPPGTDITRCHVTHYRVVLHKQPAAGSKTSSGVSPILSVTSAEVRTSRYTTQIWETLMSTYRNQCRMRRFLQGRVALELDWQKQKLIPHI